MKLLIQRVLEASVTVDGNITGQIGKGLLVFLGIEKGDTTSQADFLVQKLVNLRIFEDENGKMNLSIKDIHGEILVVSQFTLAADMSHGNRPGFSFAEEPAKAQQMYCYFNTQLGQYGFPPQNGIFQTDMKVKLINDGPATFWLTR